MQGKGADASTLKTPEGLRRLELLQIGAGLQACAD